MPRNVRLVILSCFAKTCNFYGDFSEGFEQISQNQFGDILSFTVSFLILQEFGFPKCTLHFENSCSPGLPTPLLAALVHHVMTSNCPVRDDRTAFCIVQTSSPHLFIQYVTSQACCSRKFSPFSPLVLITSYCVRFSTVVQLLQENVCDDPL
jgi:hypothetical protein